MSAVAQAEDTTPLQVSIYTRVSSRVAIAFVHQTVLPEVAGGRESLGADPADQWAVPSVGAPVFHQAARLLVRAATVRTDERPCSRMDAFVLAEPPGRGEAGTARGARVGPLPGVRATVRAHVAGGGERGGAEVAGVRT